MNFVANALSIVLMCTALIHMLWGVGVVWPARDEQALANTVVGFKHAVRMPPAVACFMVAIALLASAGVAHLLASPSTFLPSPIPVTIGVLLAAVFLGRGAITYTQVWRSLTPRQPFARLDTILYGPFCLCLGTGFAMLVAMSDG
jgi:hypothetical protein